MLILNEKIVTMEETDYTNGFVRIKDGKISDIGSMEEFGRKVGSDWR